MDRIARAEWSASMTRLRWFSSTTTCQWLSYYCSISVYRQSCRLLRQLLDSINDSLDIVWQKEFVGIFCVSFRTAVIEVRYLFQVKPFTPISPMFLLTLSQELPVSTTHYYQCYSKKESDDGQAYRNQRYTF